MFKNVAAKFVVFAFDATTNVPKTGDAANITAYVSKDYAAVTVLADTTATEFDATNAPGYYWFDAAQAETNADCLMVTAKSATANIKVIGAPAVIYTRPTTGWLAPTVAGRTLDVSAGGEAGVDWANVGSPTTANALTATTIAVTQKVDVDTIKTQAVTCAAGVTVLASVGTAATSTAQTGDSFVRIGALGAGLTGITGVSLAADQAVNATKIGGAAVTATTSVTFPAACTVATTTGAVGSVTGAVGSVTGLTAANLDATVSSRMATYTQPTGFLAATFPTTVASTTNITAATGVTLTATTGLGNQTANITGNLSGSVGSVTSAVAITSNVKKGQALAKVEFLITDNTNHNPKTGAAALTATRSIDGGAFAAGTLSAVTEVANGIYYVDFGAGDLNGNVITLRVTSTSNDDVFLTLITAP